MNALRIIAIIAVIVGVIVLIEGLIVDASDDYDYAEELRGDK